MDRHYLKKMYKIIIMLRIPIAPRVCFVVQIKRMTQHLKCLSRVPLWYTSIYIIKMLENIVIIEIENISNDAC